MLVAPYSLGTAYKHQGEEVLAREQEPSLVAEDAAPAADARQKSS